jgi:uncharacterized RDD family membrane protein YckC
MGSALLNTLEDQGFAEVAGERGGQMAAESGRAPAPSADALRQQVAERLAAHRRRRAGGQAQTRLELSPETDRPAAAARGAGSRSARIAATVAERYAQTQSYRAFLAAEAERAIQQAHAAAEVAALNAQAVAAAQQQLLDAFDEAASDAVLEDAVLEVPRNSEPPRQTESAGHKDLRETLPAEFQQTAGVELNLWPDLEPAPAPQHKTHHRGRPHSAAATTRSADVQPRTPLEPRTANLDPAASNPEPAGLTVRLYEDAASAAHLYPGAAQRVAPAAHANRYEERNEDEAMALDEEIAFRQAPVFEEPAGPPVPLPANLIEFPRQLVASRKARPRYAEGPLRSEQEPAPGDGQLRIFEVDPAQISTSPAADSDTAATPQWTAIWLDTPPEAAEMADDVDHARALDSYADALGSGAEDSIADPRGRAVPQLYVATMGRRAMAAAINGAIVLVGLLAFAATFVAISDRSIPWRTGASLHVILGQMAKWLAGQTGLPLNLIAVTGAVAVAFLVLLYQVLFFWFSEATPGMRCARIALCTFDDENPTRRAIRRRGLAMLLSACPLGLGFLWAALDEDRLTWHDRISRMYQRSY